MTVADFARTFALVSWVACSAGCRSSGARSELTLFAASSLREAFQSLSKAFEARHPSTHVVTSFAGSQELRLQIEHGARADAFASADVAQMQVLERARLVAEPRVFAHNELCVVVAPSASSVRGLADLPHARRIVLGAADVPVGAYATELLERARSRFGTDFRARVEEHVVSRENNTRQVLAKVSLGEADAAIVYRTDVVAARGKVRVIPIPREFAVVTSYPVAILREAPEPELAREWLDFVLSPEGQRLLGRAGLVPP